ncbi:MAG: hypothetical protein IJC39_00550, partial [Firmicutes bacterium]|nr:hypothetical protein [Bacillota bacterium]
MKRMFWIAAGLLLAVGLISVGCARSGDQMPQEEVEEDGGVISNSDADAPKTVESTQIIDFDCEFSGLLMEEEDTRLAGRAYKLKAKLENGAVKGSYFVRADDGDKEEPFRNSHDFMNELHKIVSEYDLAQYNGYSHKVSGLPDNYGAVLSVTYASGESIYAYDNQDCFLSVDAMEALEALFLSQTEPYPEALDISVAEEFTMENVNGCFLSVKYPVLTPGYLHWDGTYRNGEGHNALSLALDAYNTEIRMDQESVLNYNLRPAAEKMEADAPAELYSLAEVYVTRSDKRVVSFYESVTRNIGVIGEQQYRRAFNFDTVSGKKLGFADVFTDTKELPELLAKAFSEAAPELGNTDELAEKIALSIEEENGQVCFALAKGGVHFFAEKNPLGGSVGIVHAMLSYWDHPELVKLFYRPAAEKCITRLEYDMDYLLVDGTPLRRSW